MGIHWDQVGINAGFLFLGIYVTYEAHQKPIEREQWDQETKDRQEWMKITGYTIMVLAVFATVLVLIQTSRPSSIKDASTEGTQKAYYFY